MSWKHLGLKQLKGDSKSDSRSTPMFNQCDLAVLFPVLFMYKNKEESGSAVLKLVGPFVDL